MVSRAVSIIAGIALSIVLERYYGYSFLFSLSLGIVALLVIQYCWYVFSERRKIQRLMDEISEKAKRGEPLN